MGAMHVIAAHCVSEVSKCSKNLKTTFEFHVPES